jgi:flagellar FliL protein
MVDRKPAVAAAPKEELRASGPVQASLDDGAPAAEGAAPAGGLNAKKILLFVVLPLFALAAIGGGLYFTGALDKIMGKKGDAKSASKTAGKEGGKESGKEGEGEGPAVNAYFLEIPNMLVNLSSSDGTARYLRLSVQLELNSDEDKKTVQAVLPRVVDQFQTYLRELRVKDLRGSAGIYRLQTELLARVNAAAYPVEVKDVLFQEILIQ